jgi:membrane-bound serine protease (ClpP class)
VASGAEELIGAVGEAGHGFPGDGSLHLHGEIWTARSPVAIPAHAPVRVVGRDGLALLVEPVPAPDQPRRSDPAGASGLR